MWIFFDHHPTIAVILIIAIAVVLCEWAPTIIWTKDK